MYYSRFIEPKVLEYLQTVPVVIVEGARAVGKTSMMRAFLQRGEIRAMFSLTDDNLRQMIEQDILGWLRGLPMPCCIDEAQLLPDLPNAIKALMDERQDGVHLILTGSARIGQTSLGGTDALAGRAARVTLQPLSEAELAAKDQEPWSVIDELLEGAPLADKPALERTTRVATFESRGGLPHYRVPAVPQTDALLNNRIRQDISSVLTRDVLPGERFDKSRALDVLNSFLRNPAGEVNLSNIAKALSLDARTVGSYLDRIEERFLLWELPNFHAPVRKSRRTGAKCYPLDTALSASLLTENDTAVAAPYVNGGLFEAHVAQQIRAHAGWSRSDVSLSHWRQPIKGRNAEVDLVLKGADGSLIAIEVKTSGSVKPEHFKGIRAFKEAYRENYRRGFVVSKVDRPYAFSDDMWVIPAEALYSRDFWAGATAGEGETSNEKNERTAPEAGLKDARIFMSYTHADQGSITGGDLRQFTLDVVDAIEGLYGREVETFIDVKDGTWGENLWDRLEQELATSTFLLPFITPRYLKSEACREEFMRFSETAQRAGVGKLLLPLIWMKPAQLDRENSDDPLVQTLKRTRYRDVSVARRADRESAEYRNAVEEVAGRINSIIDEMETVPAQNPGEAETPQAEPGYTEYLAEIEAKLPKTEKDLRTFVADFTALGTAFQEEASQLNALGVNSPLKLQALLGELVGRLEPLNAELDASARAATTSWEGLMHLLNGAVSQYQQAHGQGVEAYLVESMADIRRELRLMDTGELEGLATQMPRMSAQLAPTSRALLSAISTFRTIERSADSWLQAVGAE